MMEPTKSELFPSDSTTTDTTARAAASDPMSFTPIPADEILKPLVANELDGSLSPMPSSHDMSKKTLVADRVSLKRSRLATKVAEENPEPPIMRKTKNGEIISATEVTTPKLVTTNKPGRSPSLRSLPHSTSTKPLVGDRSLIKRSRPTPKLAEKNLESSITHKTRNGKTSLSDGMAPKSIIANKSGRSLSLRSSPHGISVKTLDRGTTKRSRITQKTAEIKPDSPIMHKTKTGETLFFAEGVLGERTIGGCKEYRIKWKGYSKREATWEPEKKFLHSNFLRSYLADKIATKLRDTPEAKDKFSVTSRAIRVLVTGLHILCRENPVQTTMHTLKKRRCLFCLKVLENNRAFGGHVRLHCKEENYDLIREASRHADGTWCENEE